MKTIFFNIPAHGHINPILPVVTNLMKQGEQVICVNTESFRAAHERIGAQFHPYPHVHDLETLMDRAAAGNLPDNLLTLAGIAEQLMPSVIELIERERPDYIILDSLCGWAKQAAQRFQIPTVGSITTFVLTPKAMPVVPMMDAAKMMFGLAKRFPKFRTITQRMKRKFNVDGLNMVEILMNTGEMNIVFTSREFQPAGDSFGSEFVFVGPALGERPHDTEFPFDQIRRPSIYISLGTINNNRPEFYRACFDAFGDHAGTVVLSAGKNTDLKALGKIPDHFIVRGFVPQLEVLQHSDVFITHGGLNSVQEGLYYGVPLVVVPQHVEQALVGRQVVAHGAGVLVENPTASALREAVARLLSNASFKTNAMKVGGTLRNAGGAPKAAASIIEFAKRRKA
jgi:MGT family glycosyltransferase